MRRYVLPKLEGRLVVTVTSADIEALHSEVGALFIGLTKNGDPLLTPPSDAAITRVKLTAVATPLRASNLSCKGNRAP